MAFLRGGGTLVDDLVYESTLYFIDAGKAATFLNWKEKQTERVWRARREGISPATAVQQIILLDQEEVDEGDI